MYHHFCFVNPLFHACQDGFRKICPRIMHQCSGWRNLLIKLLQICLHLKQHYNWSFIISTGWVCNYLTFITQNVRNVRISLNFQRMQAIMAHQLVKLQMLSVLHKCPKLLKPDFQTPSLSPKWHFWYFQRFTEKFTGHNIWNVLNFTEKFYLIR